MMETTTEPIIKTIIEPINQYIKQDRRKKYHEGFREHLKNTHYHRDYYHQTKVIIQCPICNKQTSERNLLQHQKSIKCQLIKNNIELEPRLKIK